MALALGGLIEACGIHIYVRGVWLVGVECERSTAESFWSGLPTANIPPLRTQAQSGKFQLR